MAKKVKVTGLELETKGGTKVPLSLDEAKELYEQLDELFGKKVEYVPGYPVRIRPWWYQASPPYTVVGPYTVWNSGNANTVLSNSTGMKVSYLSNTSSV